MPRTGGAKEFVYISNREFLKSVSLETGRTTVLHAFPASDSPLGVQRIQTRIRCLFLCLRPDGRSFGGSFMGSKTIAFVCAYTPEGLQKWGIGGGVVADKSGFSGDFAEVHVFGGGRYATFNRLSNRGSFDSIIDLSDGDIVATFDGWPIAVASKADRMLVKKPGGITSISRRMTRMPLCRDHHAS